MNKNKEYGYIYCIFNILNNKKYIGQSINPLDRFEAHKYSSINKRCTNYSYPLYKAFRKYNINNFCFLILEKIEKEDMTNRELFWYNLLNPEYNQISPIEPSCSNQKIKVVRIKKEDKKNIKIYDSINEAARQNNITKSAIYNVLNKKRNTANGHYWCRLNEYNSFIEPIDFGNKGKRRQKIKVIYNDEIKIYNSINEFAKSINRSRTLIQRAIKNKKPYIGYFIEKINCEPVEAISLIGE